MAAAASDKARFFMEQSVPELQEYSRRGIFSPAEITAIAQKRSEFEHLINMPGAAKPADFARYATYEMNLDSLRKKRSKRLAIKTTAYTGQRKIFFVMERGVKKFQGDLGLWMQYLEFCREEAANRKLAKAIAQCLRLHPLKWELWVWAAKYYVEQQGDINTGRSFMQRGLRFCKNERQLWLEYAKLEMIYVAKVAARRHILGLDVERPVGTSIEAGPDDDTIMLPEVTAEDINPTLKNDTETVDHTALQNLASTPALSGAIPLAVFDAAYKQFNNDALLAERFFDLFAEFPDVPCTPRLLDHIMTTLQAKNSAVPASNSIAYCSAKRELVSTSVQSPNFPVKLGEVLRILKKAREVSSDGGVAIAAKTLQLLFPLLSGQEELDEGVAQVVDAAIKQQLRLLSKPADARVQKSLKDLNNTLAKASNVDNSLLAKYGLMENGVRAGG